MTTHIAPLIGGRMLCCGRTPFELPLIDRMTLEPEEADCMGGNPWPNIGDTCCGKCLGSTCYVDQITGA